MKTIKFYQETESGKKEVNFNINFSEEKTLKQVSGTITKTIWDLQKKYKKANLKLFKSTEPIQFCINSEKKVLLSTSEIDKNIVDSFKYRANNKARKNFYNRLLIGLEFINFNIELLSEKEAESLNNIEE